MIENYVDKLPFKFTGAIKWDTGTLPSNRDQTRGAGHAGVTELERWPHNGGLSELTRFATGKGAGSLFLFSIKSEADTNACEHIIVSGVRSFLLNKVNIKS